MKKFITLCVTCLLILGISGCSKEEKIDENALNTYVEAISNLYTYESFNLNIDVDMIDKSISEEGESGKMSFKLGVDSLDDKKEMALQMNTTMFGESMESAFMAFYVHDNTMYMSIPMMQIYTATPLKEGDNSLDNITDNLPMEKITDSDKEEIKENLESLKMEEKDGNKIITMVFNDKILKDSENNEINKSIVGKDIIVVVNDKNQFIELRLDSTITSDDVQITSLKMAFENINEPIEFNFPDFSTFVVDEGGNILGSLNPSL